MVAAHVARGQETLVSHNARLRIPFGHTLPQRRESRSAIGRWLLGVGDLHGAGDGAGQETHSWRRVLWLTGVDYFSTLGYQPGIALLAAGAVAPLATSVLVLVTLLGALPIYAQVARRSYAGQGSIAMLENLLPGWSGKLLVLILLGFAATDFVITMTLSAADATKHAIENPYLHPFLGDAQIGVTLILLALLAVVFLFGFRGAIGMAAVVAIPYLVLSLVVLGRGLGEIAARPELWSGWHRALLERGDWGTIAAGALLVFPTLALGMSGFETGVSVMPLIDGGASDAQPRRGAQPPLGRIRHTRTLLVAAAAIMSVMLVLSSVVTTLLISPADYREGGPASGRALAHLAHGFFSAGFASIYDLWTILILWLAGASAMAGLLNLVPRYLPRFGMAPAWAVRARPLVLVLFVINVVVTLVFRASVEAQSGAYATGVLALILSAALAVTLALWREERRPASVYFGAMTVVFAYTLVDNCVKRPDGVIIGSAFILLVLVVSTVSRSVRATEIRVSEADFIDQASAELGPALVGKQVHMVPMKARSPETRVREERRDPPVLPDRRAARLRAREPAGQPQRVPGAAGGRGAAGRARLRHRGARGNRHRQHDRLPERDGGPDQHLPQPHPRGSDPAGVSLPVLRGGGDRSAGLCDPPALLGVDGRGRRAAAHPPPVGLNGRRAPRPLKANRWIEWDRGPAQGRVAARTIAHMPPSVPWSSRVSETPAMRHQAFSVSLSRPSVCARSHDRGPRPCSARASRVTGLAV